MSMKTLRKRISIFLPHRRIKPRSWILTYGLPYIGLDVLSFALNNCSRHIVKGNGIFIAFTFPPNFNYIKFNNIQYRKQLLDMFLMSKCSKVQLKKTLIFQDSFLTKDVYEFLLTHWGLPQTEYSITCDFDYFKSKYFQKHKKNPSTEDCKRIYQHCMKMINEKSTNNLHIKNTFKINDLENYLNMNLTEVLPLKMRQNAFDS